MMRMAVSFVAQARRALPGDALSAAEAIYQNIGWGLELALKAFLQARGWDDDRRRTEIRHDLAKALNSACAEGLLVDPDADEFIVELSPFYRCHRIAEMVQAEQISISPGTAVSVAERLLDRIGRSLQKASRGGECLPLRPSLRSRATPSAGASPRNAPVK